MNDYQIPKATLVEMFYAVVTMKDDTQVEDTARHHTDIQAKRFIEAHKNQSNFKSAYVSSEMLPIEGIQIY